MAGRRPVNNSKSRVWLFDGGASPFTTPTYEGTMKAGTPRSQKGQKTAVTNPSEDNYGDYEIVDETPGARSNPQLPLTGRYAYELSTLLKLHNQDCPSDIQVHFGECEDPKDFNNGWRKILALEDASSDDWGTAGDMGSLNEGDTAVIDETSTFSGRKLYEIIPVGLSELAATTTEKEIIDIVICDRATCTGACGAGSDGCQKIFAIETTGGASPSSKPGITYSEDGGATWTTDDIDSLTASEAPSAVACVGRNVVVVSNASLSLHYTDIDDLISDTETWAEVTTGFVAAKGPNEIFALGGSLVWIVGNGGYIYFSEDVTAGVTVQDAGNATVQNLNAIHGYDRENLVAVGASNAVVHTTNGGDSWTAVTGPVVGVSLSSVWMKSEVEWLVGTAGGEIWATQNSGRTWTEVAFTASGTGDINDIAFSNKMVGWAVHTISGAGKLLRTIDGGKSWTVQNTMPSNQRLNAIAVCSNPNKAFAAGLGTGTDGFIVEAA